MKLTARRMVLFSVGILLVVTTCESSQAMQRGGRGGCGCGCGGGGDDDDGCGWISEAL